MTLTFRSADGLTAGQTRVRHKAVELGQVESINLSDDMSHVIVKMKMRREAEPYLTEKARAGNAARTGSGAPSAAAAGQQQEDDFVLDEEKQSVASSDGSVRYTVFDKAAVNISVTEGAGHRRQLLLQMVDRSLLPASEQAQA